MSSTTTPSAITKGSATGSSTRLAMDHEESVRSNAARGSVGFFGITAEPRRTRLSFGTIRDLFNQKLDGAAWQSKPSWYIAASEDRTVHPELQLSGAKRMGATTVELKSSHVPMLSRPREVLDVIRKAAAAVD
jgi:pimeloyl-ACP methyl ester carboxylesterase